MRKVDWGWELVVSPSSKEWPLDRKKEEGEWIGGPIISPMHPPNTCGNRIKQTQKGPTMVHQNLNEGKTRQSESFWFDLCSSWYQINKHHSLLASTIFAGLIHSRCQGQHPDADSLSIRSRSWAATACLPYIAEQRGNPAKAKMTRTKTYLPRESEYVYYWCRKAIPYSRKYHGEWCRSRAILSIIICVSSFLWAYKGRIYIYIYMPEADTILFAETNESVRRVSPCRRIITRSTKKVSRIQSQNHLSNKQMQMVG